MLLLKHPFDILQPMRTLPIFLLLNATLLVCDIFIPYILLPQPLWYNNMVSMNNWKFAKPNAVLVIVYIHTWPDWLIVTNHVNKNLWNSVRSNQVILSYAFSLTLISVYNNPNSNENLLEWNWQYKLASIWYWCEQSTSQCAKRRLQKPLIITKHCIVDGTLMKILHHSFKEASCDLSRQNDITFHNEVDKWVNAASLRSIELPKVHYVSC